jgi:hypothetical protein
MKNSNSLWQKLNKFSHKDSSSNKSLHEFQKFFIYFFKVFIKVESINYNHIMYK